MAGLVERTARKALLFALCPDLSGSLAKVRDCLTNAYVNSENLAQNGGRSSNVGQKSRTVRTVESRFSPCAPASATLLRKFVAASPSLRPAV
jgi:hypothetical protein